MQLNEMFPDHDACKTPEGAQRRLDNGANAIDKATMLSAVLQRPDGMWFAVVILGSRSPVGHAVYFATNKVCVCNI